MRVLQNKYLGYPWSTLQCTPRWPRRVAFNTVVLDREAERDFRELLHSQRSLSWTNL